MGIINSEILLETGTNEFEVLEFSIGDDHFGINVAKVRELMQYQGVQPMPRSHPCVEGIFRPRQEMFTVIDLSAYLGLTPSNDPARDIMIITSFNKMSIAFHVHSVQKIHRISWQDMKKPSNVIYGGRDGVVTGICKVNERVIAIIDFEKVVFDISPETGIQISEIEQLGEREKVSKPVLVAEDSPFLMKMIQDSLSKAGYANVIPAMNGLEAWEFLQKMKEVTQSEKTPLEESIACIITDIEMPQMDGHRLTKLVKEDNILKKLPVIIFSSLIDENMRLKGEEIGANAQISKPEIGQLVGYVDRFIL